MSDMAGILSRRPIGIRRTGVWPGIFAYLGGLLLLGLAAMIAVFQLPDIVNDWRVSRDPVLVPDAIISNGECTQRRFIFVDCSADVTYSTKTAGEVQKHIELMFVDIGGGDYTVDVVRSDTDPGLAALSLGLDMLWNRIIFGALFMLFLAGAGIALFASGWRSDANRRRARKASRLVPMAVPVHRIDKVVGGSAVQFEYGRNRKGAPLLAISRFRKSEAPFWVNAEQGLALAVMPEGATVPVVVDEAMERLDLTPSERMELKAAESLAPAAA